MAYHGIAARLPGQRLLTPQNFELGPGSCTYTAILLEYEYCQYTSIWTCTRTRVLSARSHGKYRHTRVPCYRYSQHQESMDTGNTSTLPCCHGLWASWAPCYSMGLWACGTVGCGQSKYATTNCSCNISPQTSHPCHFDFGTNQE